MSNLFPRLPATSWLESAMIAPKNEQKGVTEVRILEAAVQLVARHGCSGTSTREIAQLAGVNETTLCRDYGTEKELFWAALEPRSARMKLSRDRDRALRGEDDPAQR